MYKGEDKVLELISRKKKASFADLARESGMNEDSLRRIIESLKAGGYVEVDSSEKVEGMPTEELRRYVKEGFPEISVFRKAVAGAHVSSLTALEKSIGIRWAKVKGLVDIEDGRLVARKTPAEAEAHQKALERAYGLLPGGAGTDPVIVEELFERKLLERKVIRAYTVSYTGKRAEMEAGLDLNVPAKNAPLGKSHPISRMTSKMKSIMAELGFQEMEGDIIETSFWNFDALFQPQDHPARELADTFYIDGTAPLPEDKSLVAKVKNAHETGWKYKWDPKEASRLVLRTHTTALSARHVSSIKDGKPRKYFAIGRVFRNEATDYKHLAEFHQVEGIIAWENATFTDLLGVLKEFYRKLGFEKIRFRPSFFPYTEPSLEIEVYFEKRKQWLELGGAGIFRPEVSIPLAGVYPVLAWGLSLERPLMLLMELEDIRDFYKNDVDFLTSKRLDL